MRRQPFLLAVFTLALLAGNSSACAQGSAARLLFFNVKPGSKPQFEQAIKEQMAARRSKNDAWQWLGWEYVSGEVPRFCLASFGHDWADFEQTAEAAQVEEGRLAAAAALSSQPPLVQYFEHLDDVSDFGAATNAPTMAEVSFYQLHYGKSAQFYAVLRQFHDVLNRAGNRQRFEWFELRSGGETPQFMLLVPRCNWAGFDINATEFYERIEAVVGKRKAAQLFEQFAGAVKAHQRTAVRIRADLSLLSRAVD